MESLDFVLVQDIFMNETGEFADVILPAASFAEKDGTFTNSDRRVQLVREALAPPGEARPDWEILCDLAVRVEALLEREQSAGFSYASASEIWDEMASLTPPFQGINYDRLQREQRRALALSDSGSPRYTDAVRRQLPPRERPFNAVDLHS